MPPLCEFYPGIYFTTEEKARKNLSQGKKNLSQGKKTSVREKNLSLTDLKFSFLQLILSNVVAYLRVLPPHLREQTEEIHECPHII